MTYEWDYHLSIGMDESSQDQKSPEKFGAFFNVSNSMPLGGTADE